VTRNLVSVADLSPDDVRWIVNSALVLKRDWIGRGFKLPPLRGKFVGLAFFERSTRTQLSFKLACHNLSADTVEFNPEHSSMAKGETLKDTLATLEAAGLDALVIRHPAEGAAEYAAGIVSMPVVNAGDGRHEHPTQALVDVATLTEALAGGSGWGRGAGSEGTEESLGSASTDASLECLEGLKVLIVGDLARSRVARSTGRLLAKLGCEVVLCGPPNWLPADPGSFGATRATCEVDAELKDADVVYCLRIQHERRGGIHCGRSDYLSGWGITPSRLSLMKAGALIMHPGPVNRGAELSTAALESERSLILSQVANGVPTRMAVMLWCFEVGL
jgi:aspartate carbamoyltransferase catalytic subunit